MSDRKPIYDVFISYAQADIAWAAEVERHFGDAGLNAYNIARTQPGENLEDSIWEALFDSAAVVALFSSGHDEPPSFAFEVGAAMAWHKPVFVLYQGQCPKNLPAYVREFGMFPAAKLDHVIDLVRKSSIALSDGQRRILLKTYASLGVSTDHLLMQPAKADQLTRRFNRAAKSKVSSDLLLRELSRLRKQGRFRATGLRV